VEKPVEAMRHHAFLTDQRAQRHSSLGSESGDWPRDTEKTGPATERPINPTTVANGSIIGRQELPRDAETPDIPWHPVIERVADDIVNHARIGQRQAVLQLDPPELGKIKIDLRIEDGKLHAHITAEVRDSKLLIETHLPELRQALLAGQHDTVDLRVVQGDWSFPRAAGGWVEVHMLTWPSWRAERSVLTVWFTAEPTKRRERNGIAIGRRKQRAVQALQNQNVLN
jgi:Flagellar hook-length control protein FliK